MSEVNYQKLYIPSEAIDLCGIHACKNSSTLFIICHGLMSDKDSGTCLLLESELVSRNIDSFRFDFYAHGQSGGDFSNLTTSKALQNLHDVYDYFSNSYEKISLIGSSFGGIVSLFAASKLEVEMLILRCPVTDFYQAELDLKGELGMKEWKEKGYCYEEGKMGKQKLNYSFVEDFVNFNSEQAASKVKCPTLIIHGDSDRVVKCKQSKNIVKYFNKGKLVIISGADHRFSKHKEEMITEIMNYIDANLD